MKTKMKSSKLIVLLIALSMMFTAIPAWAADSTGNKETVNFKTSWKWVNPLYPHEEDEQQSNSKIANNTLPRLKSDSPQIFSTYETAGKYLRAGLVNREDEIVFEYKLDKPISSQDEFDAAVAELPKNFFEEAFRHTGTANEGDYIIYQLEEYECFADTYDGKTIIFTCIPTYYTTKAQETELGSEIDKVLNGLNLASKTNYEKFKAIYKWICENIEYDFEPDGRTPSYDPMAHSAYKGMISKKCVCQGYACLLYRMALKEGIDVRVVTGSDKSGEGHAWNIAKMGNKYYLCDSTWDATYYGVHKTFNYFLKGTNTFEGHDPYVWGPNSGEDVLTIYKSDLDTVDYVYVDEACTHKNVESIPAKAATCIEKGFNSGYYKCKDCGVYLSKSSGEYSVANASAVEIATTAHTYGNLIPEVPASCDKAGKAAHYECSVCKKIFDENKQEKSDSELVITALGHKLSAILEKTPTCFEPGNSAYWHCDTCNKYFGDSLGKTEIGLNSWLLDKLKAKVTLSKKSAKVKKGKTAIFKIGLTPGDSIKSIAVSKKKIAKVLSGKKLSVKVKGLKKGTAYVNVKTNANASAKFKVVVK